MTPSMLAVNLSRSTLAVRTAARAGIEYCKGGQANAATLLSMGQSPGLFAALERDKGIWHASSAAIRNASTLEVR